MREFCIVCDYAMPYSMTGHFRMGTRNIYNLLLKQNITAITDWFTIFMSISVNITEVTFRRYFHSYDGDILILCKY